MVFYSKIFSNVKTKLYHICGEHLMSDIKRDKLVITENWRWEYFGNAQLIVYDPVQIPNLKHV